MSSSSVILQNLAVNHQSSDKWELKTNSLRCQVHTITGSRCTAQHIRSVHNVTVATAQQTNSCCCRHCHILSHDMVNSSPIDQAIETQDLGGSTSTLVLTKMQRQPGKVWSMSDEQTQAQTTSLSPSSSSSVSLVSCIDRLWDTLKKRKNVTQRPTWCTGD